MSLGGQMGGFAALLRGKPHHPVGADGRMALSDHMREIRARLMRSVLVWLVLFIAAFFVYDELLEIISRPYTVAMENLGARVESELIFSGVTGPLMIQIKLCAFAALVCSSPYWLMQVWGFLVPALHKNERFWSRIFAAIAGPLFILGVAVGYWVLPKGVQVLVSFTPMEATNLVEFGDFFSFITRMLLVFGIAFEIPLIVVMLNLAGFVTGKKLGQMRHWIIMGTMVFAAVATPSPDAFSMLMLAIPMLVLFGVAEIIARIVDRARARKPKGSSKWADDELSPL